MRALTPTERGYLTDPEGHWCFAYLEVTNFDGTWINAGNVAIGARNADFLNTFSWSDNIDANTLSMSATLLREIGAYSLVPFRSDSPLNVDDSSGYSPLLDLHRQWRLWGVVLPIDTFPTDPSDYREWASGIADRIDIQGEPAIITVQGRGSEADIIDARVAFVDNTADPPTAIDSGSPKTYASGTLPTVLQAILDDEMGSGVVPLTVAGSAPSDFVNGWDQTTDTGAMDLLSLTAGLFGGLLRYKYDSSDVKTFTLFAPNRTPSSPDWTTDGGEYEKLDVGIGLDAVRNYVYVRYFDATFGNPLVVTSPNASPSAATSASIARYGRRTMSIDLAASTQVNDQTAAGNLADAARSDLEFPIIEHTLTGRGFWFAELGDYVQIVANGVHYDQDQFGGITSIQHTFENGELKSVLGMRAKPAGRYRGWLDFGPGKPRTPFTPGVTKYSADYWETYDVDGITLTGAGVMDLGEVNQYTSSVAVEVGTDDTFGTVEFIEYTNVTPGGTFNHQWAGASRASIYWFRVTPWSGPLDGGGMPTGIAGPPAIARTWNTPQVPTQPAFDDAVADIATNTAAIAAETAARIAADATTLASAEAYTDAKVAGLSWKQQVRAATTVAGTLASSFENGDTIDGVVLATGDRILIKDQATASQNGIYIVNASGAPTRAADADSGAELVNATCYVSEGTTNADTQWTCTTNATITVGSTSLAFAQLATGSVGVQSANTVYAGPTSGGTALPTFRALVAADIPSLDAAKIISGVLAVARLGTGTPDGTKFLRDDGTFVTPSAGAVAWRQDFTRTLSVTVNDTVELGSYSTPVGTHYITLLVSQANCVLSKSYLLATTYGSTGGAWQTVYPSIFSTQGNGDLALEVWADSSICAFRLRRTSAGTVVGAMSVHVSMEYQGATAPTFTGSTTTSTSAITAVYADRVLLSGLAPSGASNGYYAVYNSTTGKWEATALSVSGSAFSAQTANQVFAGPTSGGSATPGFRALVAADIPSLDAAKITTGVLAIGRLATGTPNGTQYVRDDGTLAVPPGSGATGAEVLITETVLGASASTIAFSSISNSYRDLRIVIRGRGTASATFCRPRMQFNSDTSTNYMWQRHTGHTTSVEAEGGGSPGGTGATFIDLGTIPAATQTSGYSGAVDCRIFDYRGTTFHKNVLAKNNGYVGGERYAMDGVGSWRSTSAITDILFILDSGSYAAGTIVSLYGIL